MLDKILDQIAEKVLALDEESLTRLLPQYVKTMDHFQPTREWEKAVIIYFLINSVRVKNTIFNDNVKKDSEKEGGKEGTKEGARKGEKKPDRPNPFKIVK